MDKNKKPFSISNFVQKQKTEKNTQANPINLEALVNSGRVRIKDASLQKIEDKSQKRKK